jgi:hypothetical protein
MIDALRLVTWLLWGWGTLALAGYVLQGRLRAYRLRHDARALRELLTAAGLFIVSLATTVSVSMATFAQGPTDARGLFVAIALGAFTGTLMIMASDVKGDRDT